MLRFSGRWRITVLQKAADFEQRAVVRTPQGVTVIPGRAGASHVLDTAEWELSLEHSWGAGWFPNIRVLSTPATGSNGRPARLLRSKDRDWPGDTVEQNFVLRLDQLDHAHAPAPYPSEARAIRTTAVHDRLDAAVGTTVDARRTEAGGAPVGRPTAMRTASIAASPTDW
ncbi:hypothetical protein [Kitasatospora sp. NE20-6]|uniref:hypothetical protein n=1 Tax=Kitasatospora sp. NE20-6 TaxID=2859066 RepID=UPI0038B2A6EB